MGTARNAALLTSAVGTAALNDEVAVADTVLVLPADLAPAAAAAIEGAVGVALTFSEEEALTEGSGRTRADTDEPSDSGAAAPPAAAEEQWPATARLVLLLLEVEEAVFTTAALQITVVLAVGAMP